MAELAVLHALRPSTADPADDLDFVMAQNSVNGPKVSLPDIFV